MTTLGPAAVDRRRLPRPARVAIASVPWLLAAALLAAPLLRGASDAPVTAADTAPDGALGAAHTDTPAPEPPPAAAPPEVVQLSERASLAVRAAAGTALGADGGAPDVWVLDAAIVETVELDAGHAVAIVHARVIEHDGTTWTGPALVAAGVGLVAGDLGWAPAGAAWPLPAPTPVTIAPGGATPVTDDVVLLAVTEALTGAGWRLEELTGVTRTGRVLTAVGVGVGPGRDVPGPFAVWLTGSDGQVVVAALPDGSGDARTPTSAPATGDA